VFGRAYGLALPASIAGIVIGSAIAPVLVSLLGAAGALAATGGAVLAYTSLILRRGTVRDGQRTPAVPATPDATVLLLRPAVADA
jgi:hypothetical protein